MLDVSRTVDREADKQQRANRKVGRYTDRHGAKKNRKQRGIGETDRKTNESRPIGRVRWHGGRRPDLSPAADRYQRQDQNGNGSAV